jgi:hypothetical protein
LTAETKRSAIAEKEISNIVRQRNAIEAELAVVSEARNQLRAQLAEQQKSFETQAGKLASQNQDLEARRAQAERKLEELALAMQAETKRSEAAEKEVALSARAQVKLRAQLAELQQSLNTRTQTLNVELANSKQLEAARLALEEKAGALAELLAAESKRAEEACHERNELAGELAMSNESQADLSAQLTEQKELTSLTTAELEGFRRCAAAEAEQKKQLTETLARIEKAKAGVEQQLTANQALLAQRDQTIRTTTTELQRRREEQERLELLGQAETAQRQQVEAQLEKTRTEMEEKAAQLARTREAEEAALKREAALQTLSRKQLDDLAQAATQAAELESELKKHRSLIEELETRRSALSAKLDEMTEEKKAAANVIQGLEAGVAHSRSEIAGARRELAALRYAILDASRLSARQQRERLHQEQQKLESTRQLSALLLETPLSLAQRNLLADLQTSVDGQIFKPASDAQIPAPSVEMPGFHNSEFSLAELTESACHPLRTAAAAAGATVRVATAAPSSLRLNGYAEHIYQLITLLTVSPLAMSSGITVIDLHTAAHPTGGRAAEMDLRIAFATKDNPQALLDHFTKVTAAPALPGGALAPQEFGLAAGWQLAIAMGSQARIEPANNREVCLVLSIPLELARESAGGDEVPARTNPRKELNHGHAGRNGKSKLLAEARA